MGAIAPERRIRTSFARADVLVLCYHSVRIRERFAAQMTALAERGYSVLSLRHFLEYQVIGSKQRLEDALGQRVTAFSYPDGARNPRVASLVRQAGFDAAFTVDLGGVSRADDPYQLKRVSVLGEPKAGEFLAYLSGTRLRSRSLLFCWKMRERLLEVGLRRSG